MAKSDINLIFKIYFNKKIILYRHSNHIHSCSLIFSLNVPCLPIKETLQHMSGDITVVVTLNHFLSSIFDQHPHHAPSSSLFISNHVSLRPVKNKTCHQMVRPWFPVLFPFCSADSWWPPYGVWGGCELFVSPAGAAIIHVLFECVFVFLVVHMFECVILQL